jgi:signal recognition particle GTPase
VKRKWARPSAVTCLAKTVTRAALTLPKRAKPRAIPIRFLGVGEGIDDLRPFRAREFVSALLD